MPADLQTYEGRSVLKPFVGFPGRLFRGKIEFARGSVTKACPKGLWDVMYDDGDKETSPLDELLPYVLPSGARPELGSQYLGQLVCTTEVPRGIPQQWDIYDRDDWHRLLSQLMPWHWSKGAVTRLRNRVVDAVESMGGVDAVRHVTDAAEITPLLEAVRWDQFSEVLDPWAGSQTISTVLSSKLPELKFVDNDLDEATECSQHLDALQPIHLASWVEQLRCPVVVTSPFFACLDIAVPLLIAHFPACFIHVPCTWVFSATPQRQAFIAQLVDEGRLQIITNLARGSAGAWRCCWFCVFHTEELRMRTMVKDLLVQW